MDEWEGLVSLLGGDLRRPELAGALAAFYREGRAAWPALPPLSPADLVSRLAFHLPPESDPVAHVRSLVAPDFYLACACLLALPGAIETFDAELLARVPSFIAHIDRSPDFADEIRQTLRQRLLVATDERQPRIADYSGRGALATWVRVSAVRIALNHRADPYQARRIDDQAVFDKLAVSASADAELLRARHAGALTDALKHAMAALTSEQRIILRMYFAAGQSTDRIAAALRVNRSTAARRLVAARQAVFAETRRLLQERLPVDTEEFASLALALHDQLNISLSGLLADPA
jgi:RNA polymerase sigma-70 factor